ncbi:MAG: SDR family NAD(P)-dependent oxidoreductase [Candidatus Firestonebacteria bacterium]
MNRFRNKCAIITGAGGSMGMKIAKDLMKEGAKIFCTDSNISNLNKLKHSVHNKNNCIIEVADVTKLTQVKNVVGFAIKKFGKVDILINTAGIVGQKNIEEITEAELDCMFNVNVKGTFFFIQQVISCMKKQKYGRIINFSSKSGKTGSALMSHYSATKAAIIGLTQALAYEFAPYKITVNAICPGITSNTNMWNSVNTAYAKNLKMNNSQVLEKFTEKIPLKRLATLEDISAVTLFLASDDSSYMTGQALNVDGGREMH